MSRPSLLERPARSRSRLRRLGSAAVAAVAVAIPVIAVAAPTNAAAAQYPFDACQHPNNAVAPTTGFGGSFTGSFTFFGDACSGGGGLGTSWATDIGHNYQDGARYRFSAPAGTSLAFISARRDSAAGADQAFGSPVAYASTEQGQLEGCTRFSGCRGLSGQFVANLNGASTFEFGIVCGGGPDGVCPAGEGTSNTFKSIQMSLNDDHAPTFTGLPTGTLLSATTTARVRTLNYSAADQGGGLYRQKLSEGATSLADVAINANGGKCERYPGGGFPDRIPCATNTSGSLSYDTIGLSEGDHELTLQLRDATNVNAVSFGPWPIKVDNLPPVMTGTTEITGVAQAGEQLTCVPPTINGQNPTITYSWARSASDGSGRTVIDGATQSRYTLTGADRGFKLQCTARATDQGGANSRESSLTSGPFANGGVVTAGQGPTTTGTTRITGESTLVNAPKPGGVLAIDPPTFTGSGNVTLAYAWLRCSAPGQCSAIPGATGSRYTITDADKNSTLVGQVTASDSNGSTVSRSEPTGTVASAPASTTPPTPDPVVTAQPGPAGGPGAPTPTTPVVTSLAVPLPPSSDPRAGLPNGEGACREATLSLRFTRGSRTTVGYNRTATLRGRLKCSKTNRPIRGAELDLAARTFGRTTYGQAKTVRTSRKDGTFSVSVPKGAGRQLRMSYTAVFGDPEPVEIRNAMFYVRGSVQLTGSKSKTVTRGGTIRLSGKLRAARGTIPANYKIAVQALDGRRWRVIDTVRVSRRGTIKWTYRCKCNRRGDMFKFRVSIPGNTRLPYKPAVSRAITVRVR